jgi:hypothetical protein
LIVRQLGEWHPDMLALNEIHIPEQTGRWLQRAAQTSGSIGAIQPVGGIAFKMTETLADKL